MKMLGDCIGRREFMGLCGRSACALSLACLAGSVAGPLAPKARAQEPRLGLIRSIESPWYEKLERGRVRCGLCPRQCVLGRGRRGACRVRENRDGKLYSLVYGNPSAIHLDPVEKNPLFHVLPSTRSLCLATAGCNLHCRFCQVWELAQSPPEEVYSFALGPEDALVQARNMRADSIAFTYVEPVVFLEYAMAVSAKAREEGLLSLVHTAGFIREEPLEALCNVTDAFNVDLKGFTPEYYRDLCSGELEPVLDTLRAIGKKGIHREITALIVPTRNDDPYLIHDMAQWIGDTLGADTPLHFTRFYPLYQLRNLPPTPAASLEMAREAALGAGLHYVYIGNVPGHEGENTFCPNCGRIVIDRTGFMVNEINLDRGRCRFCGFSIPGIWETGRVPQEI